MSEARLMTPAPSTRFEVLTSVLPMSSHLVLHRSEGVEIINGGKTFLKLARVNVLPLFPSRPKRAGGEMKIYEEIFLNC